MCGRAPVSGRVITSVFAFSDDTKIYTLVAPSLHLFENVSDEYMLQGVAHLLMSIIKAPPKPKAHVFVTPTWMGQPREDSAPGGRPLGSWQGQLQHGPPGPH